MVNGATSSDVGETMPLKRELDRLLIFYIQNNTTNIRFMNGTNHFHHNRKSQQFRLSNSIVARSHDSFTCSFNT